MTQQEIKDRNEQIALMLGKKEQLEYWKQWVDIESKLKWHSDWNWLMEAVEFIEKLNYNINIFHQDSLIEKDNKFIVVTHAIKNKTKKESVFIAVSDFAKLHNNKQL